MVKSSWKARYIDLGTLKRLRATYQSKKKIRSIRLWTKASVITPGMIGLTIEVYDGQKHVPIYVTENKVGYKLGQFMTTRNFRSHIKKDKRGKR